jgi:hypothetical protein
MMIESMEHNDESSTCWRLFGLVCTLLSIILNGMVVRNNLLVQQHLNNLRIQESSRKLHEMPRKQQATPFR